MPDNKNICLLGFSPESETRIKKIISDAQNTRTVNWVPANFKGLDGVVINAGFLSTPQIQKYLSLINCPVVCAYNNNDGAEQAQTYKIISLDLRSSQPASKAWLGRLLGIEGSTPEVAEKTPPLSLKTKVEPTTSTLQPTTGTGRVERPTRTAGNNTQDLLSQIRRRANTVIRAEYGSDITWIKPREGLVFINYPRESVSGFDLWTWQETTEDEIPDSARKLQLDLWLFESLWQSEMDGSNEVEKEGYYRLIRFPQPLGRHGRTEALRLATFAQSYPVNIELLHDKTGYSREKICRFLFATLIAGQVKKVERRDVHVEPVHQRSEQEERKVEQKRSLLQRFREKLGL